MSADLHLSLLHLQRVTISLFLSLSSLFLSKKKKKVCDCTVGPWIIQVTVPLQDSSLSQVCRVPFATGGNIQRLDPRCFRAVIHLPWGLIVIKDRHHKRPAVLGKGPANLPYPDPEVVAEDKQQNGHSFCLTDLPGFCHSRLHTCIVGCLVSSPPGTSSTSEVSAQTLPGVLWGQTPPPHPAECWQPGGYISGFYAEGCRRLALFLMDER